MGWKELCSTRDDYVIWKKNPEMFLQKSNKLASAASDEKGKAAYVKNIESEIRVLSTRSTHINKTNLKTRTNMKTTFEFFGELHKLNRIQPPTFPLNLLDEKNTIEKRQGLEEF